MGIRSLNRKRIVLSSLITLTIGVLFCPMGKLAFSDDGQYDHLKCYKISNRLKAKAIVNIDTDQFELEEGCVVGKAKRFCVPAIKTVVKGGVIEIDGQAIDNTFICYRIRCEGKNPKEEMEITDQFGNKIIEIKSERMLCVPACIPSPEVCGDGRDNDCDGATDCLDKEDCCPSPDGRCVTEVRVKTVQYEVQRCVITLP